MGEKLNVATILEGSMRKEGQRVRVTAQLIKVADGFHLWSETYDRQLSDIFAVQDEIARSVAGSLKVALLGGEQQRLPPRARMPKPTTPTCRGGTFSSGVARRTWRRPSATTSRRSSWIPAMPQHGWGWPRPAAFRGIRAICL